MRDAKFIKIAEDLGWSIYQDEREIELQKYIGSGQDFSFSVRKGFDFYRQVEDYYNGFDPDEEAMLFVDDSGHGKNGAPYRLKDIITDMEEVEDELKKLCDALISA